MSEHTQPPGSHTHTLHVLLTVNSTQTLVKVVSGHGQVQQGWHFTPVQALRKNCVTCLITACKPTLILMKL